MAYLNSYKDQNWLIPMSIKDMIPEAHICFFVEEFVESLDFSGFDIIYAGAGHHPRGAGACADIHGRAHDCVPAYDWESCADSNGGRTRKTEPAVLVHRRVW